MQCRSGHSTGVRVRVLATSGLLALAVASAAIADSPFTHRDGSDEGDSILPITSYPLGQSQVVSESMARNVQMYWIQKDMCDQMGCLIIQNDAKNYKVADFRIELVDRDGSSRWSRNQLLHPLLPTESVVRLKVAPAESCARQIKFTLQHRKTKEKLELAGTTDFCPSPHATNMIRINVKSPEVTVEDVNN